MDKCCLDLLKRLQVKTRVPDDKLGCAEVLESDGLVILSSMDGDRAYLTRAGIERAAQADEGVKG